MDSSNTASNSTKRIPGKPFTKNDPRINRKGRPRNFDALQALFLELTHEVATKKDGSPVVVNDKLVTIAEAVARQWLQSGEFAKQKAALEIAYGKVPQPIDITSKGERITGYAGVNPDDWDKSNDASDAGA